MSQEAAHKLNAWQSLQTFTTRVIGAHRERYLFGVDGAKALIAYGRAVINVREAKGGKDRVVMLPHSLAPALRVQMLAARSQWELDRQVQRGGVETPHAIR